MRVIAEAYEREPLDRQLVGAEKGLCYLVPFGSTDDDPDEIRGVGFPERYVFEFDGQLLADLTAAFQADDTERLTELWAKAHHIMEVA